ncbi:MAG: hypothetical protein AB1592_15855 [Pseudomonadota bacterium]
MPSSPQIPSPDNDYAAPAGMILGRVQWDAVFASVGERLRELEAKGASWDALVAIGTSQALASIAANVAPHLQEVNTQVTSLQQSVAAAQDAISDINAGAIPATTVTETAARIWLTPALRDGWSSAIAALETWRSAPTVPTAAPGTNTAAAASTAFVQTAIAALINAAPGALDTLGELAAALAADANFAATVSTALAKRVRVDAATSLTAAEQGQARANIGAGTLSGVRSKLINGNFDHWQRGTTQTSSGYGSDDRWLNNNTGSTKTHSQQLFTPGQTAVPGNPTYYSRTVVTSVAGASNYVFKSQAIRGVGSYSGQTITFTFWGSADAPRSVAVELIQSFGTGGSPSATVLGIGSQTVTLSTSWQRYSLVITIPSITGKVIGTNQDDYLSVNLWFDAGSTYGSRTASLGQQSGTFNIARASVCVGNATAENDPFPQEDIAISLMQCQQYYRSVQWLYSGVATSASQDLYGVVNFSPSMVRQPTLIKSAATYAGCASVLAPTVFRSSISDFVRSSAAGACYGGYTAALDAEIGT